MNTKHYNVNLLSTIHVPSKQMINVLGQAVWLNFTNLNLVSVSVTRQCTMQRLTMPTVSCEHTWGQLKLSYSPLSTNTTFFLARMFLTEAWPSLQHKEGNFRMVRIFAYFKHIEIVRKLEPMKEFAREWKDYLILSCMATFPLLRCSRYTCKHGRCVSGERSMHNE